MLLQTTTSLPVGENWMYEIKYDGFRCILKWKEDSIELVSRTGRLLNQSFPELITYCEKLNERIKPHLPLTFDGELVVLKNDYRAQFSALQTRNFLRKKETINEWANKVACHYLCFDLLKFQGKNLTMSSYNERKEKLCSLFTQLQIPLSVQYHKDDKIQLIATSSDGDDVWRKVLLYGGEGIVAKDVKSRWFEGKRTNQWLKLKHWRYVSVFLTKYDQKNGYFHFSVQKDGKIVEIGNMTHGFQEEQRKALETIVTTNSLKTTEHVYKLAPSICFDVACIDFDGKHLREARFHQFRFDLTPLDCTWEVMQKNLEPLPPFIEVTHPEKPVWPAMSYTKDHYLHYLREAGPSMLPFLFNRPLTVIRLPHGVRSANEKDRFYQKNCPDYAPEFVSTVKIEQINYILCNELDTLLWLGNQLALEFHTPFNPIDSQHPSEIVFDLDPPSSNEFSLAIEAALRMKDIFEQFKLHAFVKTSGGKGLQVYLPLPDNTFSYRDTRMFTSFICQFLYEQEPQWFTTERLKKHRQNRLYLDYLQHESGKTIIAPFSPRGNEQGLVATPLEWEELTERLSPTEFSLSVVLDRIHQKINPFRSFHETKEKQPFSTILEQLKANVETKA